MAKCFLQCGSRLHPVLVCMLLYVSFTTSGQTNRDEKVIDFPAPMKYDTWRGSIGFSFLTTPEDITEEVRLRVPAGELTVLRKLNEHFNLSGQLTFQILQNHLAVGGRWVQKLSDKVSFSAGDE